MTGWIADLRHAYLVYRSTPIATATVVVAMAVAMAFVSAFLSMWNDLSLKPPEGFQSNGRLVTIGQSGGYAVADGSTPLTLRIVESINERVNSLQFAAGVASFSQVLHQDDSQIPVQAEAVTRHFSDLRPRLELGRLFDEQDHARESQPAVILSYRLWQDRFDGRADILGETLRISEAAVEAPANLPVGFELPEPRAQDYLIVGIMSRLMVGTFATSDIWLPYEQAVPFLFGELESAPRAELGSQAVLTTSNADSIPTRMRGLAQLAGGAGAQAASDELNARLNIDGQALALGLTLSGAEIRFDVIDGLVRDIDTQREAKRQVRLFLAGTLLLVLVATGNISLFLLARASRRQREMGIRMAVGASMRRLAKQLAAEAGLLILVSTAIGVLFSLWLSAALRQLPFLQLAEWRTVSPFDWRVLGILAGLMLLFTVLVSLAPVFGLRRMGIGASSGLVMARAGWGQRLAGTVQVTLTGIVGAVAAAFVWHLVFYMNVDRGFNEDDVLLVEFEPPTQSGSQVVAQAAIILERERQRALIAGLPGVEDATLTSYAPGGVGNLPYTIVRRESGNYVEIATVYADPHYFDVLGIPLVHGSMFDPRALNEFVSNETYSIATFGRTDIAGEFTSTGRQLMGVVRDVAFGHPAEASPPTIFIPWPIAFYPLALVKTGMSPAQLRRLLQQEIDAGELQVGLSEITRLSDIANRDFRPDRIRAVLTVSSAALVVILAAIGFYGTQRYLVTAGRREYAIRSALGAGPRALGRLVISRGLRLGLPGLIVGIVLAFLVVAWLRDGYVTTAVSPAVVSAAIVLMIVALILAASFGPALQASRSAPASQLRD